LECARFHAQNEIAPSAEIAGALFRSDNRAAVKPHGRSHQSDIGCQRQRLSFVPSRRCADQSLKNTRSVKGLAGRAVPNKRSSPPAVKSGVCIGGNRPSQGGKSLKNRGFRP